MDFSSVHTLIWGKGVNNIDYTTIASLTQITANLFYLYFKSRNFFIVDTDLLHEQWF